MLKVTLKVFVVFVLCGCSSDAIRGSGTVVTSTHRLTRTFNGVEAEPGLTVFITYGESDSLSVQGDDNVLEKLEVREVASTLYLGLGDETYAPTHPIEVRVETQRLSQVTADASRFIIGPIPGQSLSVVGTNKAEIEIEEYPGDFLSVVLINHSMMTLTGEVDEQVVVLSDGSRYNGFDLHAADTSLDVSDHSVAEVRSSDLLDVVADGESQIRFRGEPVIESSLSELAEIEKEETLTVHRRARQRRR